METGTQKINCQRSMEVSPAKGSLRHSPVFSLCSVMFTNTQVVDLTWSGPEAAKKGCACVNETVSYFFPADVCQDRFVAPKGGVRASLLTAFYSKTSAHPTENLPSLKGTLWHHRADLNDSKWGLAESESSDCKGYIRLRAGVCAT